jgi:hypothetical protein
VTGRIHNKVAALAIAILAFASRASLAAEFIVERAADIGGSFSSNPQYLAVHNSALCFTANAALLRRVRQQHWNKLFVGHSVLQLALALAPISLE